MQKSLLIETFGETPMLKIIDFFITFQNFDYSKTQAAEEAGISRTTIEDIWSKLIKNGIIVRTRTVGRAELYRLNKENFRVKAMIELDMKISGNYARSLIESGHSHSRLVPV